MHTPSWDWRKSRQECAQPAARLQGEQGCASSAAEHMLRRPEKPVRVSDGHKTRDEPERGDKLESRRKRLKSGA